MVCQKQLTGFMKTKLTNYPKISIVIPTFERIDFLEECIESIINQNYPNLELFICDGGSKNESIFEIFKKYEKSITNWDSIPDKGHSEAIRRGIDKSTGDIIGYLCSDDMYEKNCLFELACSYVNNPEYGVFYGNSITIDENGKVVDYKRCFPFNKYSLFTTLPWCQPATFWTRAAYAKAGKNFGGKNWEFVVYEPQIDLISRIHKAGVKFKFIKKNLAFDRRHSNTVTFQDNKNVSETSWKVIKAHHPILTKKYIHPIFFLIMRIYQIVMLITIGDTKYIIKKIK